MTTTPSQTAPPQTVPAQRVPDPRRRRSAIPLGFGVGLVLAVHAGLALLARRPDVRQLAGDEITYLETARRLLAGEPHADELLWPPLYARFLAGLEQLARVARPADRWHMAEIEMVQTGLLLVAAACAGLLARRVGLPRGASFGVGLAVAAYPPLAAFAHYLWPEVVHLAFFLGALAVLAVPRAPHGLLAARVARAVAGGVLLGLALLTKSLLTGFVPVVLVAVWLDARSSGAGRSGERGDGRGWWVPLAAPLAVLVGLLAVVGPTLVHNHRTHGVFAVADSSLLNLWIGLQDDQRRNHLDSIPWHSLVAYRAAGEDPASRRDFARRQIAELLETRGLVATVGGQLSTQYFRLFDRDSYLLDLLPGGALTPEGYGYLATPRPLATALRVVSWILHGLLLALAAWGLAHERPGRDVWRWVFLAFLGYNLLLFLGLHVKTRYLAQLLPFLMLWAARGGLVLAGRGETTPRRRAVGVVLVVLVLGLAFGGRAIDALTA